jgi:hypothetical protein
MVISVAYSIFYHQKSKGGWYEKRKDEEGEGIACNGGKKGVGGEKDNPTRIDRDKDG